MFYSNLHPFLLVIILSGSLTLAFGNKAVEAQSPADKPNQDTPRPNTSSNVEQQIQADLSLDESYKHMTFLVEEVGERLAGTKSIARAAGYIKNELESYGLEARIDRFYMYHSYPREAALRVIAPETRVIKARPVCHICSTHPEGLSGELVYAGAGGYEDYENIEVKDKIILTDMTWSPPRPEKARIAYEKKAQALIIMNWGTSDNPVIQMGAVKSVWGNPTPENFQKIPQLPVISITRAAGEYLQQLCTKGEVRVWLAAEATREWVRANQPVAFLPAAKPTDQFVLVGGHLEAWGKTAICNSSGNAQTLELARVFAKHKDKLKRNIIFAFWDGHEIAEAAGSTYFVDANWDQLKKHCLAYVNIDNPGIIGTSVPMTKSGPEIRDFQMEIIEQVWQQPGQWSLPYKGGDESFLGIGVPYISFATGYTPAELIRLNYASLSPWLHSEADTIDKIDKKLYEKHLHFFASLILKICNSEVAPYNLTDLIKEFKSHLESLERLSAGIESIKLDDLLERTGRLEQAIQTLNEHKEKILSRPAAERIEAVDLINKAYIKVTRQLSAVLWTEAGRYDQDPYGYYLVGKPIPRLYLPLIKMQKLIPDQQEFHLWHTKLIREKNRVSDAIDNTIDHVILTTKFLEKLP
ncbi:MAG: hypothetical protein AMJ79_01305 [Phycisphaerae bacterium SM23_30]|nr:MAG: hypothetical protein AMJ79_01305 [Phycisphaerae bacterium SM23_30]